MNGNNIIFVYYTWKEFRIFFEFLNAVKGVGMRRRLQKNYQSDLHRNFYTEVLSILYSVVF